jgi:hypothetical protein
MTEIVDFSTPKEKALEPIRFKVDDDTFEAYAEIGGGLLMDVIAIDGLEDLDIPTDANAEIGTAQLAAMSRIANAQSKKMIDFLDEALLPDSQQRFAERMRSRENPISLTQVFQIARWLLAQYGARPTEPPSSSVNGHGGSGETSMAGAQPEV